MSDSAISTRARTPVRIDLFGGWDLFAFIYGTTLMVLNTFIFIYAVCNRAYPPIKAKNMPLIAALYICILIWFLGIIGTNLNLPNTFDINHSCIWLGSWFRVLLGIFLFVHIHVLRLYIYIRIFNRFQKVTYKVYLATIAIYLTIIAAYGIPTTILQNTLTVVYDREYKVCRYGIVFTELTFALVWVGWVAVLLATFLARKINTSFNEYREMLVICTIITTALTYQTVIHHVVRNYLVIRWARVTSTMMELTACQLSLMILLFTPCFNCMFNRTRYQKQWYEKMRSDGMTARYGFDTETFSQQLRQQEHQQLSSTLVSNTSSV